MPAEVVARVGTVAITRPTLDHWTAIVAKGGSLGEALHGEGRSPSQRALDYLISAQWTLGEASSRKLHVTDREIQSRVAELQATSVSPEEYSATLKFAGRSGNDLRFEVSVELAATKLREAVKQDAPKVTEAQIRSYYTRRRAQFAYRERRDFELVENLPSKKAAVRLLREVGHRPSFGKLAFKESLARPRHFIGGDKGALIEAIFLAETGVPSEPLRFFGKFAFFAVRRIVPAGFQPMVRVRTEIHARLEEEQRRVALASFTESWRARWRARTACLTGAVMRPCAEPLGKESL